MDSKEEAQFQDSSDEFTSGSSEDEESYDEIVQGSSPTKKFNLYKFISDPNPLMRPEQREDYYIRNAVDQELLQLPDFFDEVREKEENFSDELDKNFLDFGQCLDSLKENFQANEQLNSEERSLKTLFRFHHDNPQARLVYKRYYDLFPNKYYASYICDLKNVFKNKNELIFKQLNNNPQAEKEKAIKIQKNDLVFDSRFESGNLFQAWKISNTEYNLILQNDINSKGNTQWFFFSVQNAKKGQSITFNIINLNKKTSLFQKGMLPCVYSVKRKEAKNAGWKREGYAIKYYKSFIQKEGFYNRSYYTLSFTYTFQYNEDVVYFAYSYPYTYSDLNNYLKKIEEDPKKSQFIHRKIGCKTLAKNNMDVITITSSCNIKRDKRKLVYFMARQHPGEVTGSFIIEGVINYLIEDTPEAELLRQHYVFKIIPMINPDGVIHGNNRCSLAGIDLNRKWRNPHKKLHPCINYIKNMIKKNLHVRETKLLVDFHGHSKKLNAFFYGNTYYSQPELTRIFPMMLSKYEPRISFEDCRFKVQKYYESTARIALWRMLRIPNVFTLEASFYGYQNNEGRHVNFTPKSYIQIGRSICTSLHNMLLDELKINPDLLIPIEDENELKRRQKEEQALNKQESQKKEGEECLLEVVINDLQNQKKLIDYGEVECSGSESSCSGDELDEDIMNMIMPKNLQKKKKDKKKRKKSFKEDGVVQVQNKLDKRDSIKQVASPATSVQPQQPEQKEKRKSIKTTSRERITELTNIQKRMMQIQAIKSEKQTQTDEYEQNAFNFLKKTQENLILQDKKQKVSQLPPRPYFIKNSNNYSNSVSLQLNQDVIHSQAYGAKNEDEIAVLPKINPYIIQRSIEEGRLSNLMAKNFCITGQKVKDDQCIQNVKQIEVFKSAQLNCREVSTQTSELVSKLRNIIKQDKQQQNSQDNDMRKLSQHTASIDHDTQTFSAKQYFNRKRNFTLNGPTLNQILLYKKEESQNVNQHINHNKLFTSNHFRKRDLSDNPRRESTAVSNQRESNNLNSSRNSPTNNNALQGQIPFSVLKQEFQKTLSKQQKQKDRKQSSERNQIQIFNGSNMYSGGASIQNQGSNQKQIFDYQDTLSLQKMSLKQNENINNNNNNFNIENFVTIKNDQEQYINKRSSSEQNQQIAQNLTQSQLSRAQISRPYTNQVKNTEYDENQPLSNKIPRNKSQSSATSQTNRNYLIKQRKPFGNSIINQNN
ncbi:hypothetical protein ABPG74_004684 [Tetrahymena malaccensis]